MTDRNHLPWGAAGYSTDPIPGSPDRVSELISTYDKSVTSINGAAGRLRKLTSRDQTISDAIAKIMKNANDTASALDQAASRYSAIAKALRAYEPELRSAQSASERAVIDAKAARDQLTRANDAKGHAQRDLNNADQTTRDKAAQDVTTAQANANSASSALADAKSRIASAIAKRNTAADSAASQISMDLEHNALNDSTWDKIKDWVASAAKWVWDNLDIIALVLDVIALVLVATGIGAPLAAALFMVSKALRVLSTIKTVINLGGAVLYGLRTGDWESAGMQAAGIVAGWALGKVIGGVGGELVKKGLSGPVGQWASKTAVGAAIKAAPRNLAIAQRGLRNTMGKNAFTKGVYNSLNFKPKLFKDFKFLNMGKGSNWELAPSSGVKDLYQRGGNMVSERLTRESAESAFRSDLLFPITKPLKGLLNSGVKSALDPHSTATQRQFGLAG